MDAISKMRRGMWHITDREALALHAEIVAALEGDSNDAEHDALVSVAEWLGIEYTPIDYCA